MIPENNNEFWGNHPAFGLLHLYIVERVRSFSTSGLPCFMSNEQFARETNTSISTVSRAIKQLVAAHILHAKYHQESGTNKQRVLTIHNQGRNPTGHNEHIRESYMSLSETVPAQIDDVYMAICKSDIGSVTTEDSQDNTLVYKRKSKENNKNINDNSFLQDFGLDVYTSYSEESGCKKDTFKRNSTDLSASVFQNDEERLDAKKQWDEHRTLSSGEREKLISDIEGGFVAEGDIPLWAKLYQKYIGEILRTINVPSVDEIGSSLVEACCVGAAFREVETELKATCGIEAPVYRY